MLLLTAFSRFNQWAGPFVLERAFLSARSALGFGGPQPVFDAIFLHPFTKLVSIECHHQYRDDPAIRERTANGDLAGAAELRVRILETRYIKPSVLARHWRAWSAHERFKRWLRAEVLLARHGPAVQKSFRGIRSSPQFRPHKRTQLWGMGGGEGGNDTDSVATSLSSSEAGAEAGALLSKLPTTRQIEAWLDAKDWTVRKDTDAATRSMRRVALKVGGSTKVLRGGALCVAVLPLPDGDHEGRDGGGGGAIGGGQPEHDDENQIDKPSRSALSNLRLEEMLELSGGHVQECGPLNALCEHYGQYQVYTREYVQKLGEYLVGRVDPSRPPGSQPDVILDVGAGDGLLAQLLNDYFESCCANSSSSIPIQRRSNSRPILSPPPRALPRRGGQPAGKQQQRNPIRGRRRIVSTRAVDEGDESVRVKRPLVAVATDDGSWRISARAPVERLSVQQALQKYAGAPSEDDEDDGGDARRRVTVLCSWMPMGLDWTALFRRHGVDEYVLVGECDDGQCGHNWETWGNPHFRPSGSAYDSGGDGSSVSAEGRERELNADADVSASVLHVPPPFELDGYERRDLDFLAPHQFSRYDSRASKSGRTVSFRRRRRSGAYASDTG